MQPKLVSVAGPLRGNVYGLSDQELTIGRELENWLSIQSMRISRFHCTVRVEADQLRVVDLESTNGTYVNDLPIRERYLNHGDQLRIGDCSFVFLSEDDAQLALDSSEPQLSKSTQITGSVVEWHKGGPYKRPEIVLRALLQMSTALSQARHTDEVQSKLLDLALEVIPVERAAILLFADGSEEIRSQLIRRRNENNAAVPISGTIVRRVKREEVALLCNNLLDGSPDSLARSHISWVLAVPLSAFQKIQGVVYLDTTDPQARFDEHDLQLLSALGSMAAATVETAGRIKELTRQNERLSAEMNLQHQMVGEGRRIQEVYGIIAKAAPTNSTILISGESGTGKELAARAIHAASARANGPFVAINCATLTEALLESELFGHEKGAFTGAVAQKKGKIELAAGGTLFLDEIGELALGLQAKLLRVLQEREFERVGGTRPIRANVRLVAATNRDLAAQLRQGSFRQDLYYRLNVVTFMMPPLRERREDIPLLASYFANKYAQECGRAISGISREAREMLVRYEWPGNVRELENAIERAVVLGTTEDILSDDLPDSIVEFDSESATGDAPSGGTKFHETIRLMKRQLVVNALKETGQSYPEAAKLLGLHLNNLYRLAKNLNLKSTAGSG